MRRSRAWARQIHGQIAHDIPEGHRIGFENCYATHSLPYDSLPEYCLVYVWWDEDNNALSYDETKEYCELIGLHMVPELYRGVYDEEAIHAVEFTPVYGKEAEGAVIRLAAGFHYDDYLRSTAKVVRPNHVQTDEHWTRSTLVVNGLVGRPSPK